jgi:hypothetical protein
MRRPEKPLCKCLSHLRMSDRFIVRILFFALAHNFVCVLGALSLLAVIQPRMFAVCFSCIFPFRSCLNLFRYVQKFSVSLYFLVRSIIACCLFPHSFSRIFLLLQLSKSLSLCPACSKVRRVDHQCTRLPCRTCVLF